jgi:type II secretory pathway pseudopilin PulG
MRPVTRPDLSATTGFSLVELLVAMGLFTMVMGITLSGLSSVMKSNELVMTISAINNSVRGGLDLMVRDMLQVGSGLPSSHAVGVPNGVGSEPILIPGPPGEALEWTASLLPAVMPRAGAGPTIDGIATDVVTVLMADNAFLDELLTAVTGTTVTVAADADGLPDIEDGPDRVLPGQLMMIKKGSVTTLVQVTAVDPDARILTFAAGDSLNLNQPGAANGSLAALILQEPLDDLDTPLVDEAAAGTTISRVRMITYYLDADADPMHPRLVRRINNGDPFEFDNTLGTAVAIDAVDLQFTYDISNGQGNPGGVEMNGDDMNTTGGGCDPLACGRTQIRKVNLRLTSRAPNQNSLTSGFIRNTLESQISLRAMAFVDRYNRE